MIKGLTHWVLLISLVGQFLLSPAMALPDILHTLDKSDIQIQQRLADTGKTSLLINFSNIASSIETQYGEHGFLSDSRYIYGANCDDVCQVLASGHCTTHAHCPIGLHLFTDLFPIQDKLEGKISESPWPIKTVTLHIVNPPPIT
ncbi:hypothetical protein CXF83_20690 [Shewanella sp. Choline-02u-19]|uniref:hypothetical protein n=1 Tax=unclassified Shewanella TaxID=196818 RepID=UPI000C346AEA|nr:MULTISPECIES: hypothetical protein [unclassified Shewanella]PKG58439.1 hypothetical protein CXF82_04540 [Shewanella sp. GutDb-MelDb]PKG74873.1 hypothetical protein CXF86_09705 [Shewanella sp. GutCb]PKH53799.1 hypothetical protein CXF84_21225 [Shewanella sp. Bg11-22]PKI28948.1 hypothetical protein CXF83_20690 [Shewanella sp. Choline-02u-19]